jgi:hypothetical protein
MKTKKAVAKKAAPAKKVPTKKVAAKKGIDKKKGTAMAKAADVPKVNHIIPKALGLEMIARFKKNIKDLSKVKFEIGKQFDKYLFEELLKLKGIQTVRIYNAIDKNNNHTFVITGLDANSYELYFKIKSRAGALGKDGGDGTVDGVGDMGTQCTEPPKAQKGGVY